MKRIILLATGLFAGLFAFILLISGVTRADLVSTESIPVPGAAPVHPQAVIVDLGTLGGPESAAAAVNSFGRVVGSSNVSGSAQSRAFVWSNGVISPLLSPDSVGSTAYDINNQGRIAGHLTISGGQGIVTRPVRWTGTDYLLLETPDNRQGTATAVNESGVVAGHTLSGAPQAALLWPGDSPVQTIPFPNGIGEVYGINGAGHLAGRMRDSNGRDRAFLRRDGTFENLGALGGNNSIAWDLNDAGQVVGAAQLSGQSGLSHAFLWQNGKMTDLSAGDASVAGSVAKGINNAGVIVGQAEIAGQLRAVMWRDGKMVDLNSYLSDGSVWERLESAEDINEMGWIAGHGRVNGLRRAFLLKPLVYHFYFPLVLSDTLAPAYDMTQFMIGDGRLYEVRHNSGSQARHQTQTTSARFFHTKGNEVKAEWEELWADDGFIYRGTDTSPGNNEYYTLYEGDVAGSRWSPRSWRVGELYERNPFVVFYRKSDCRVVRSGFQRSWLRFDAYHPSYTFQSGITLENVVELAWLLKPDGSPIESYFYAEDYGLVGWGSNDRGFSYVNEIHTPGQRPDNKREVIPCIGRPLNQIRLTTVLNEGPLPFEYRVK